MTNLITSIISFRITKDQYKVTPYFPSLMCPQNNFSFLRIMRSDLDKESIFAFKSDKKRHVFFAKIELTK